MWCGLCEYAARSQVIMKDDQTTKNIFAAGEIMAGNILGKGYLAGFGMTIWMSRDWPLLVGGKPIAPIPPYVVLGFELTILIGALSTVAGVIILSMLKAPRGRPYDPRFSDDRIGVFVPCAADKASAIETLFRQHSPVEVTRDA